MTYLSENTSILFCPSFYSNSEKINGYVLSKVILQAYIIWKRYSKIHTYQIHYLLFQIYLVELIYVWSCLILLAEYIQFRKNQLYIYQEIMKPNVFLYFFLSSRFMIYAAYFFLSKLFLEKSVIKSRLRIEIISNVDFV